LGSIVVQEKFRGQGLGAEIIHTLLSQETGTVYLQCQKQMISYYAKFGFEQAPWWQAPMPLRAKAGIAGTIARFFGIHLIVMRRPAAS